MTSLESFQFLKTIRGLKTSQNEFDSILQQSPERVIPNKNITTTEFDKIDQEILITTESNEYEIEECSLFDQGADERRTYQCLFKNGSLVGKQRVTKKKHYEPSRTSIKNPLSSLSSSSCFKQVHRVSMTKQRSNILLKQKVQKMTGKLYGSQCRNSPIPEYPNSNTKSRNQSPSYITLNKIKSKV